MALIVSIPWYGLPKTTKYRNMHLRWIAISRAQSSSYFHRSPYLPTCGVSLKDLYWLKPGLFIVMSVLECWISESFDHHACVDRTNRATSATLCLLMLYPCWIAKQLVFTFSPQELISRILVNIYCSQNPGRFGKLAPWLFRGRAPTLAKKPHKFTDRRFVPEVRL